MYTLPQFNKLIKTLLIHTYTFPSEGGLGIFAERDEWSIFGRF